MDMTSIGNKLTMTTDPTLTFDVERIKMEQDNMRNELAYLRRQIVKLNIKIVQYERSQLQNIDRLRHGANTD